MSNGRVRTPSVSSISSQTSLSSLGSVSTVDGWATINIDEMIIAYTPMHAHPSDHADSADGELVQLLLTPRSVVSPPTLLHPRPVRPRLAPPPTAVPPSTRHAPLPVPPPADTADGSSLLHDLPPTLYGTRATVDAITYGPATEVIEGLDHVRGISSTQAVVVNMTQSTPLIGENGPFTRFITTRNERITVTRDMDMEELRRLGFSLVESDDEDEDVDVETVDQPAEFIISVGEASSDDEYDE